MESDGQNKEKSIKKPNNGNYSRKRRNLSQVANQDFQIVSEYSSIQALLDISKTP